MKINATLAGGECPRTFYLKGRLGWTFYQLRQTGAKGVSPLECPALRWSSYIHQIRQMGIPVDTEMEHHGGLYKGRHARYGLACAAIVTVIEREGCE